MQASAPSARALHTSTPERMPPSTMTTICPFTASAMAGSTAAVEGTPSWTRPPWLDTTMPAAPASRAFLAPFTVMTPLMIKGTPAYSMTSRSSATVLDPAGGLRPFRKGRPAASMSMANTLAPEALAASSLAKRVSLSQGLTVGMPLPPLRPMALAAASKTAGSVPSPVKAAMPTWAQASTRISLYSMSVNLSP